MIKDLSYYKESGSFSFGIDEALAEVCNAPKDKAGVYVVYAIDLSREKPIYIGSSGKMQNNGRIKLRKGGLFDRIVNGKQFDEKRKLSWPKKMNEQQIGLLQINWYVTFGSEEKSIPGCVEATLMQEYFERYMSLPDWNKEF